MPRCRVAHPPAVAETGGYDTRFDALRGARRARKPARHHRGWRAGFAGGAEDSVAVVGAHRPARAVADDGDRADRGGSAFRGPGRTQPLKRGKAERPA